MRESSSARPIMPVGERPPNFGPGRTCAESGCTTILSIYNHSDRCSVHDDRAESPGKLRTKQCAVCGRWVTEVRRGRCWSCAAYFRRTGQDRDPAVAHAEATGT